MDSIPVPVTLTLAQWQFVVNSLAQAPLPYAQTHGVIGEIMRAGREASQAAQEGAIINTPERAARGSETSTVEQEQGVSPSGSASPANRSP